MQYTIRKLARMAGVSTRTLRYYDEIGLLKPARHSSSGYRIYGKEEVDRLQHILFYRELGVGLERIQQLMNSPSFDEVHALKEHDRQLLEKRAQLDVLIRNVEKTIASKEGRISMSDKDKFEGFKQKMLEDNERKYGKEIREKYGEEAAERSNRMFAGMTQAQFEEAARIETEMRAALAEALKSGDPAGEAAQQAADLHRRWLGFYWPEYNKEAHAGLTQMYVDDERFRKYYDEPQPGAAEMLRDAVRIYIRTME